MAQADPRQEDYERRKGGLPPAAPKPPPASFTRSKPTPASPAAKKRAAAVGGIALGVLLLILAVVFHVRYAAINGTCHTGLGQVGQAFSGNAYLHCAEAANFESGVGPFVVIGLGIIVLSASELVSLARKAA